MNKIITMLLLMGCWMVGSSSGNPNEELTKEDRKAITQYLKKSKAELISTVKKLSPAQWNYKSAPDKWSVAEICEHIIKAEPVVLRRVDNTEAMKYKPELMAGYKEKGEEMISFIVGRTEKFQAPEPITPVGSFSSPEEFIKAFEERRDETYDYVKSTDKPIKAYYELFGPVGEVNGYHWLMFISAHTERHMAQINEVLNNPEFPI